MEDSLLTLLEMKMRRLLVWGCVVGMCLFEALTSSLQLLTVFPQSNSLAVVYRDKDSLCFTKYINHRANPLAMAHFHTFSFVYRESNKLETSEQEDKLSESP